jgi:hypothetical protein
MGPEMPIQSPADVLCGSKLRSNLGGAYLPIGLLGARLKAMSVRRIVLGVGHCAVVCGMAITGCSSSPNAATGGVVAPSDIDQTAPAGTACAGFDHRYVGGGLTVDLPTGTTQVSGESTADPGPVHASETHDFVIDSSPVTVGRRVGSDVVHEPLVSERVSTGVVLFAKASNEDLRACLLASMVYDQSKDLADE